MAFYALFTRRADLTHVAFMRVTRTKRCSKRLEASTVLDVILVALGFGFFALMAGYVAGCDRV